MNRPIVLVIVLVATLPLLLMPARATELLRNPSFETVPAPSTGDSMPSEWIMNNGTPDVYSNDGSFGLPPFAAGNFTDVVAQDGIRWIAGWSLADERFGQLLTAPLTPGESYLLSGYLHRAVREDLANDGGYNIYLTPDSASGPGAGELLGLIGPTSSGTGWENFTLQFEAPATASGLPFLLFQPFGAGGDSAYPGLDNLSLQTEAVIVPEAGSTVALCVLSLAGMSWIRRRDESGRR